MASTKKPPAKKRGFAGMSPEKRREAASKGGKAVQAAGTAHRFTTEEARAAAGRSAEVRRKEDSG